MINLFVAYTDNSWFDFLASEHDLREVNFGKSISGGREKPTSEPFSRVKF